MVLLNMSTQVNNKRVTVSDCLKMKSKGEKISMLTAYDFTMAKIIDRAGVDIILVGDSASNTMAGHPTTLAITLDQMIYHAQCVVKGTEHAMVIVDMPFGTCAGDPMKSLESAIKIMRETGADALKVEGGFEIKDDIKKIIDAGIPVMIHLGLMPQHIHKYGTYGLRGREEQEAEKLVRDCLLMEELGAFGILLEKIPASLAKDISAQLSIPTIGIGAGDGTDGQVLVIQDIMGMNPDFAPKFVRKYANLYDEMTSATKNYIADVKSQSFPSPSEQYQ